MTARRIFLYLNEGMLNVDANRIRYQNLLADDEKFCGQNDKGDLLPLPNLPRVKDEIHSDDIDARNVMLEYLHENVNIVSCTASQILRIFHGNVVKIVNEASKTGDDDVMKCKLSVTEGKLQCSSLATLDVNYVVVNDAVIYDEDQGAVDHKKYVSISLTNAILLCTQSGRSLQYPKWLDESDASLRLEESVASTRMDDRDEKRINICFTAVEFRPDDVAEAEVNYSTICENDNDLPEGWKVTLNFLGDAVRVHSSQWLDKSIPPGRLVLLTNISLTSCHLRKDV